MRGPAAAYTHDLLEEVLRRPMKKGNMKLMGVGVVVVAVILIASFIMYGQ